MSGSHSGGHGKRVDGLTKVERDLDRVPPWVVDSVFSGWYLELLPGNFEGHLKDTRLPVRAQDLSEIRIRDASNRDTQMR
jgi:hypothetical protein